MSSGHRETWNHGLRTLLRNTRDSLVPPIATRVAALDSRDNQHLGESDIAQSIMTDSPTPRGPPNIPVRIPPHIAALQERVGCVEDDVKALKNSHNDLVGLPADLADLTKAVGDQARIFEGLSLSSSTGSRSVT